MIIDFHTHTFPPKIAERAISSLKQKSHSRAFSNGTVDGLLRRDLEAEIDLAVVLPVATSAHQVLHVNDSAFQSNFENFAMMDGEPAGVLSLASMHPALENMDAELDRIYAMGFPGIKIHPVYQGEAIDSLHFLHILDGCAKRNLLVVTHGGYDIGFPGTSGALPKEVRRAVRTVDPEGKTLRLISAHMGGWKSWQWVAEELSDTSVFLDTSFSTGRFYPESGDSYYDGQDLSMLTKEGFMELYRAFGSQRIVFGTDSPWSDAKESLDFIRALPLSEEEQENLLWRTGDRLLRAGGKDGYPDLHGELFVDQ